MWLLVTAGGALGTALGWALSRALPPRHLATSTAVACALAGILSAYPQWRTATTFLCFGVLGSAPTVVLVSAAKQSWVSHVSLWRSGLLVARNVALHCAVGVTFAMAGYLCVRAGTTLYVKLR